MSSLTNAYALLLRHARWRATAAAGSSSRPSCLKKRSGVRNGCCGWTEVGARPLLQRRGIHSVFFDNIKRRADRGTNSRYWLCRVDALNALKSASSCAKWYCCCTYHDAKPLGSANGSPLRDTPEVRSCRARSKPRPLQDMPPTPSVHAA